MSSFRLRPCFSHVIDLGVEATRQKIVESASREAGRCEVKHFAGFVCLRVPESERHYWSPRLNLSLEPDESGGTRVAGIYGPNANMWSSFLYGYLLVGTGGLFSGILGYCQWTLGMQPWGLWIFFTLLTVAIGMYLLAQFGQKLGARQTFQLHQVYEAAVGVTVEVK
ncbi:MAG: hypothetical protein R3F13_16430 [Prosthecobacter sp.]